MSYNQRLIQINMYIEQMKTKLKNINNLLMNQHDHIDDDNLLIIANIGVELEQISTIINHT